MVEPLWERMMKASEECLQRVGRQATTIAKKSGVVEGYPMKKGLETLQWIINNLQLEIENEDFSTDLKYGRNTFDEGPVDESTGRRHVQKMYKEILARTLESAYFWVDKDLGFEERPPRPKTKAEKMAELLMEPFTLDRKWFFQQLGEGSREQQRDASKKAVLAFITDYDLCLRSKIPELK